jgi:tellurite resistance protein TerC
MRGKVVWERSYGSSDQAPNNRPDRTMPGVMAVSLAAETTTRFVSIDVPGWAWIAVIAAIVAMLLVDLLVVHRRPHVISFREAATESAVWIAIGLSFSAIVAWAFGAQAAGEYLTGYLIEESLSIDNVFVWAVILSYFAVPAMYQFRVLFWGIFGALILRATFIFAGVALLERFEWILYIFGAFLLFTAVRIARHQEAEVHPEQNPVLRIVRRLVPMSTEYDGQKFFTRISDKRVATPLFAVLILIESTDVVFAVDSVPAILAVSREPFIVFTSNAFAILGLRALYFLLAGMAGRFRYLNVGLAVILAFVGVKMLITEWFHFPTYASLVVIVVTLTIAIWASIRADRRETPIQTET